MKKTLASVLAFLLVVLMVFAGVAPVISYAAENKTATKSNTVTGAIDTVTDWFELEREGNELVVTLNPDVEALQALDYEDLKALIDKILDYAKDTVVKALNDEEFRDTLWDVALDAYLTAKDYDSIAEALDDPNLPEELVGYARELILAAYQAGIIDVDDIKTYAYYAKDKIAAMFAGLELNLGNRFDAYIDDKKDEILACFEGSITEIVYSLLTESVLPGTELSLVELFAKVDEISINGYVIYGLNENGKAELNPEGIKGLILSVPGFGDISNMSDDEMQFSFDVAVKTDYGTSEFALTAKVGSGHEYVRAAAAFLCRYFNLDFKQGNTVVLEVNMPELFTKALLKAANTDLIDAKLKQKVFGAFMATGNDVHALIKSLSYEDLIALLQCIDFEGLFDREFVQQFVDLSAYSNEDVIEIVNRYEKYFTLAIKYGARLADAVANRIPDRYMDDSFLDLIEYEDENDKFHYEDGTFSYVGTHTLTYDHLQSAITKVANLLGVDKDTAMMLLVILPESFVENGFTATLDFSIHFEDINRIDYMVDGKLFKAGFLPAGAKVEYFAEATNPNLLCWVDEDLNVVTTMPDHDIVLYAVYNDGRAYLTKNVDKLYDGASETVGVFIGDNANTYTFEWYKNGVLVSTSGTFEVANVSDSGEYNYVVKCNGAVTHEGSVTVKIDPILIPADSVALDKNCFEFDGKTHTVNVVGLPAGVTATVSGTTSASAVGEYTVLVTLNADNPNYTAEPATVELTWCIKKVIDVSELEWNWPADKHDVDNVIIPVYDGNQYVAYLTGEHLEKLDLVLSGNLGVNAGEYLATIVSVSVKAEYASEYMVVGLDNLPTLEWRIDPQIIHVTDVAWGSENYFLYDGEIHGVRLESYPAGLIPNYTNNATTEAGNYVASVTFSLPAEYAQNYVIVGEVPTFAWTIEAATFDISDLVWSSFDGFVYDGTDFTVELTNLPSFIGVTYTDNVKADAGTYTAVATLVSNTTNYVLTGTTLEYTWSVEKATVTVTDVLWNYVDGGVVYNGAEQSISAEWTIDNQAALEFIVALFTGNTAINVSANGYEALVSFESTSDNYVVVVADGVLTAKAWNVAPMPVDVSTLTWNYTSAFTYNGSLQGVTLVGVPAGVEVVCSNNSFTNAGNYTATAVATALNANYTVVGAIPALDWTINKANVDASGIKLENATVTYDGKEHSLTVSGDASILEMLEVTYTGNGKVLLGTYTVTATLTLKSEYAANYSYSDELTATLTITGDKKDSHELKDNTGTIVIVNGSLDPDNLIAGGVTTDVKDVYEIDGKEAEMLVAYDIYFTEGGAVVSVDGQNYTVKLLIPAKYRGLDDDQLAVIHIKDDGTVELMEATREGNYMTFTTTHFSKYAIVSLKEASLVWLWILLAVLVVGGAVVAYVLLKKRNGGDTAPDAIPEVSAAPVAEEAPAAEVEVEEEPVVEEVEEIPEVDEVVEEETEEEIPEIDEVVAEEEEDEVAEEESAPVSTEPQSAVLVMGEDGKEATAIIGGETVHIRFRSSFMSRLIQSTENIQCFYSEIKNHVLSYKGIKARGSWNYEAFNKGRTQLVKLNIKGKTLIVNLNLDPKEFNINKYHFIDCSDKPKFAKVPMMMKVRSARALKYTLELIDELMAKNEIEQGEVPTVDYRMPYETTEELAKKGLVKVILPAGVTLSDDMTVIHVNVSELIGSGNSEKTSEQFIGEDIDLEVEEAPEKFEPVVEVLEDGTVHADAEFADQLISDEEAEAQLAIASVPDGVIRTGKMGEINLDTICDNFDDGEIVDVDTLKAKRLLSAKYGRVKVLARGIMYKKLTVRASKFSIQAVKMINLAGGQAELDD